MKSRMWRAAALAALAAGAILGYLQLTSAPPAPLASLLPAGALLYLEAKDFSALLKDWNSSPEKAAWLTSDNYQVFSRSKLFGRLKKAQDEYAQAAGFPPSLASLANVAGSESALALYNIGALEFVYVSRLPRSLPAVLDKARPAYQTRQVAGINYYISTDAESGRVAAFAFTGGLLVLGTREDLVSGTLRLIAGQGAGQAIRQEGWFDHAAKAAGPAGDLRMIGNLEALVRAPQFRSYWVHQNITELKQFSSFVSDVFRSAGEIREERVLVRAQAPDTPPAETAAVGDLVALAPASEGFYQAWAAPQPDRAAALIAARLLAPRRALPQALSNAAPQPDRQAAPAPARESGENAAEAADESPGGEQDNPAPGAAAALAEVGGDLETRIDEAPLGSIVASLDTAALEGVLAANPPDGLLEIESARELSDKVFVGTRCALVLLGKADWNAEAVRSALAASVAALYSTAGLGLEWTPRSVASAEVRDINGLLPLSVAARGKLLIVANSPALVDAILAQPAAGTRQNAVFAAGYRHARELPLFRRMTRMIDAAEARGAEGPNAERQPAFLSEDMASLGASLKRVLSVTIVVRDTGATVPQTVVYRYAK